jgi:hypothetical protein
VWSGRSRGADVYLSGTQRWWRGPDETTFLSASEPWDALHPWVLERAKAERVTRVRAWLGGSLCRVTMSGGIGGTTGRDEAEVALAAALQAQGLAQATDLVRLPAPIETAGRGMALLVSEPALQHLAAVEGAGVVVSSVKPWWAPLVEQGLEFDKAAPDVQATRLAVFDGEALTVLAQEPGKRWSSLIYAPVETAGEAQRALTRTLATTPHGPVQCAWLRRERFSDRQADGQGFNPRSTCLRNDRFGDGI